VLVPGDLDAELTRIHASLFQHQSVDADSGPSARTTNAVDNALSKLASAVRLDCSVGDRQAARRTVGKIWQDGMLSSGLFMHGYDGTAVSYVGFCHWYLFHPGRFKLLSVVLIGDSF